MGRFCTCMKMKPLFFFRLQSCHNSPINQWIDQFVGLFSPFNNGRRHRKTYKTWRFFLLLNERFCGNWRQTTRIVWGLDFYSEGWMGGVQFGWPKDTPGEASPGPRRASAASWFALCSAPSPPHREWGNPAGGNKSDWFLSQSAAATTKKQQQAFTISSNLEYLSVSVRNISLGGTFIFASLAIWNGQRNEWAGWFPQKKKTEPCETSCSSFFLAASSFFSFFSSSIWQKKETTVNRLTDFRELLR